jgi:hypothetical protein
MLPLVASAQGRPSDVGIYRWNSGRWLQVEGYGTRISVGPDGSPWVINSRNEIFRWNNGAFDKLPGTARDIGIGGDGTAWIIGTDNAIYRWNGREWARIEDAHGVAISVDRSGRPWVINTSSEIYEWDGTRFIAHSGTARDIGAGDDVWLIGTDNQVYRRSGNQWMPMGGRGERISAGSGTAWVVNEAGEIYQWMNGDFRRMPGSAMDIATNASGQVWMAGTPSGATPRVRRPRNDR